MNREPSTTPPEVVVERRDGASGGAGDGAAGVRQARHDMLNTLGVVKLRLHALRKRCDQAGLEAGVESVDALQGDVQQLQDMLERLCEAAKQRGPSA